MYVLATLSDLKDTKSEQRFQTKMKNWCLQTLVIKTSGSGSVQAPLEYLSRGSFHPRSFHKRH